MIKQVIIFSFTQLRRCCFEKKGITTEKQKAQKAFLLKYRLTSLSPRGYRY